MEMRCLHHQQQSSSSASTPPPPCPSTHTAASAEDICKIEQSSLAFPTFPLGPSSTRRAHSNHPPVVLNISFSWSKTPIIAPVSPTYLAERGSCLFCGDVMVDVASFTTRLQLHSPASKSCFGCVALLDRESPQYFTSATACDRMKTP